ncbi:A/G-specific DNA-adenine glycosylase [Jiangella alkaliphila]|uniref:Adenine DNA glycosylase n=2 Tax=Jiangella alkaliphila TaxID=419479 RepID=A0A1H2FTM0_9ACTN|nr:A/G-specific DNA-adenine glycosylase [Jiangella alkaliphila]
MSFLALCDPLPPGLDSTLMHATVLSWYSAHARDLPWRAPGRTPWGVLVSEIMLQQTPVVRVEPVWHEWMRRWPRPADLAAEEPGEAIRAWGRLGYPRRALRLHAAAGAIVARHGGDVPGTYDELIALPGIGDYTAAAVASFAFGARHAVLDTNVRRVLARAVAGTQYAPVAPTSAERRLALDLVPDGDTAPRWAVAVMELGALVCTARSPRCSACPIADQCAWRLAGSPPDDGPPRRGQPWHGTDRQVRGRLMAILRDSTTPVPKHLLEATWPDPAQRERALDTLVADGLIEPLDGDLFRLPTSPPPAGQVG